MAVLPTPKQRSIVVKYALQLPVSEEDGEIALGTKTNIAPSVTVIARGK